MTNYQFAKQQLKAIKISFKHLYKSDKPRVRQILNNSCYEIIRDLGLSEYKGRLLDNYCCKLHPK